MYMYDKIIMFIHSHVDDRLTLAAHLTRIIAAVGHTSLKHLHSSLHSNRRLLLILEQ